MIGHSSLEWHRFVQLLERHQITKLIDVRTRPYSRWLTLLFGVHEENTGRCLQTLAVARGHRQFSQLAIQKALKQVFDAAKDPTCLLDVQRG
jgi:hypothetical protein